MGCTRHPSVTENFRFFRFMTDFDINSPIFDNSPLATIYHNVKNELKLKMTTKRPPKWHHNVALWVAWESHKVAPGALNVGSGDLLKAVGLPAKQKDLAKLLGVDSRTIRNYAAKYGHFVETARADGVQRILSRYDLPALHALGVVATSPSGGIAAERKLFFQMRGMLPAEKIDANIANNDDGRTVEEWKADREKRVNQAAETMELFKDDDVGTKE